MAWYPNSQSKVAKYREPPHPVPGPRCGKYLVSFIPTACTEDGCKGGWMTEEMDECMDGWMDRWLHGRDGRVDG